MTEVDAFLTSLQVLTGIALLIICATIRLILIEVQLRTFSNSKDEQAVNMIAGYMLRGRSCRGALFALYGAAIAFVLSSAANRLFVSIGLSSEAFMRVTGVLGAALLILGLGLLVIDTFMSLESAEHAARRTLDNRQRR
ncbi:MAG: hypothetical protein ACRBM6_29755 [Geminicoccales bacterium]